MIRARSFWFTVVYHLDSRTLPCRLSSSMKRICRGSKQGALKGTKAAALTAAAQLRREEKGAK